MTDATAQFFNMTLPLAVVNALIFLRAATQANPFEANVSGLRGFYFNSLCILKRRSLGREPFGHEPGSRMTRGLSLSKADFDELSRVAESISD